MEEIINSIMHNPENTNPNVLRDQLRGISNGAGVVIVEEYFKNGIKLNIKAEELYDLSKNNIIFCKLRSEGSIENYIMLESSSCQMPKLQIKVTVEPEGPGYYFKFYDFLDDRNLTFTGYTGQYPSR